MHGVRGGNTVNKYRHTIQRLQGQFVYEPLGESFFSASDLGLEIAEAQLGCSLPEDYRIFLRDFGGCAFRQSAEFPIPNPQEFFGIGSQSVDVFYALMPEDQWDLLRARRIHADRIPNDLLPIADCQNSQLCLGIEEKNQGEIFFWDRSLSHTPPDYSNVHFIANSFEEFIQMLRPA